MQTLLRDFCGKSQPGPWAGAAAAAGDTQHPRTDCASPCQMPDLWHTRTVCRYRVELSMELDFHGNLMGFPQSCFKMSATPKAKSPALPITESWNSLGWEGP